MRHIIKQFKISDNIQFPLIENASQAKWNFECEGKEASCFLLSPSVHMQILMENQARIPYWHLDKNKLKLFGLPIYRSYDVEDDVIIVF